MLQMGKLSMTTFNINYIKQWAKGSDNWLALLIKKTWFKIKAVEIPNIPILFKILYFLHIVVKHIIGDMLRVLYYTPLFKARLSNTPKQLYLYGGLPVVIGSLDIIMGDRVRLAAMTTISGRAVGNNIPTLVVGDNVDISWRTSISVGKKITIGDNVRIAGDCYLAGYPGHPINAKLRALGKPEHDSQIGDITLENDVWLATGVKVMPGVTIGQGTIIGAGSVVTKDLPSFVLAGGIPAIIIRSIENENND
jgi:serine acetyltransferase